MKNRYTIHVIYPTVDSNGEVCGGDATQVDEAHNEVAAFRKAATFSLDEKYHETMVYRYEDGGDIVGHWYFSKGKQTQSMF